MRVPCVHIAILAAFLANTFGPIPVAQAQDFRLPAPGVMVRLSPEFNPSILKGIKVHPDNPFRFDFILDKGDSELSNDQLKDESSKLIKYFLASLTIPEKDLWVNLSPYEKDRIIPQSFGLTQMGRDLLAEDYMLKQITASLIYPEDGIGKRFWKRIYEESAKEFGTTNIPVNTFNKVWIIPEKAVVYENAKAGAAYVVESKLKVMLEEDYLSLQEHNAALPLESRNDTHSIGANIVREIVIPELTKEVNQDKNFAQLRQVYNSLILAAWYKKKIKDSILSRVYADKNKVTGVNINDPQEKQKIYERYLQAFKLGAYNYIKEEADPLTQQIIPRKYFSGGTNLAMVSNDILDIETNPVMGEGIEENSRDQAVSVRIDPAMNALAAYTEQSNTSQQFLARLKDESRPLPLIVNLGDKHGDNRDLLRVQKQVREANAENRPIEVIIHGDVFDRGRRNYSNYAILKDLKTIAESNPRIKVVFLLGNHEVMLLRAAFIKDRESVTQWIKNEGSTTFEEFYGRNAPQLHVRKSNSAEESRLVKLSQDDQIDYMLNNVVPSLFMELAKFILNNYEIAYQDEWNYLHLHALVPLDDNHNPEYTLDEIITRQKLWERLRMSGDNNRIFSFLNRNYWLFWTNLQDTLERENLKTDGTYDMKKVMHYVSVVGQGRLNGIITGHEGHGLMPGAGNVRNMGNVIIGIDMGDYHRSGKPGHFIMSPRGFYFQPLQGASIPIASRENLIENFSGRIENLGEMIIEASRDGAMRAPGDKALISSKIPEAIEVPTGKSDANTGGIDLRSDNALSVLNNGQGIQFHIDPAMLAQLQNALGFTPDILSIQPMTDIKVFLGLRENSQLADG